MTSTSRPVAVVTGASSGIGAEFARRYAREGYDLVLVARSERALSDLAAQLTRAHAVDVRVFVADLSDTDDTARVASLLSDDMPRLDHLVNCAGAAVEGDLTRTDGDQLGSMIAVNIAALTELTRVAVVRMRRQGSGTIVNVASAAAYQPMPHMAAYSATKSYVLMFTEAVSEENRVHGVRILAVSPGATTTPMNPGAARGARTPRQVVDTAWRAIAGRGTAVIDGFANTVLARVSTRLLPRRMGLRVAERMMREKA